MQKHFKVRATENDKGRTLLKYVENLYKNQTKSAIEKCFRKKDIKINGKKTNDKKYILKENDQIEIYGLEYEKIEKVNVKYDLNIVFEDENILIINKKPGIIVHGEKGSLDNQVISYLNPKQEGPFLPTHIGRLDKVTSGIILYGKNYETVKQLKESQSNLEKRYVMISGLDKEVDLESKIFHDEEEQKEKISDFGKDCHTIFKPVRDGKVEALLVTGRKHQIRASLEHLGFPIKGDTKYGATNAKRVYLHSLSIKFLDLTGKIEYLNNQIFMKKEDF